MGRIRTKLRVHLAEVQALEFITGLLVYLLVDNISKKCFCAVILDVDEPFVIFYSIMCKGGNYD